MYDLLFDFAQRPVPFSRYTAKALWTRPHLARQMLKYHLSQDTDLASRKLDSIDHVVAWLDEQLQLAGKHLCDLGCGPGLYAERFADKGARVTGVDFSPNSLDYARHNTRHNVLYQQADYLEDPLPDGLDIVTLIYCDLCALSPTQRQRLLQRIRTMLKPGGRLVLDVFAACAFEARQATTAVEENLMGGFWSETDYVGLQRTFLYPEQRLVLDRYLIVEPEEQWQIFNWLQYFTPDEIRTELEQAGFQVLRMTGSLTGEPLTKASEQIGIIARA